MTARSPARQTAASRIPSLGNLGLCVSKVATRVDDLNISQVSRLLDALIPRASELSLDQVAALRAALDERLRAALERG